MLNFDFPESLLNKKIKDGTKEISIREIIECINFTEIIEPEIKNYLSLYGTFFDGINFYYDSNLSIKHSNIQKNQIIMNEILNFLSLYFTSSRKMSQASLDKHLNRNLICLYNLGLVEKKVWYANSARGYLMKKYKDKYGILDVILFTPNDNARQYLNNCLLTHDLGMHSSIKQIVESSEIIYGEFENKELYINEHQGIHYITNYQANYYSIIKNKNPKIKSKTLTEEFFSHLKNNNLELDSKLLSTFNIDENIIDNNIQFFDMEILSEKKLSQDFIKKYKNKLNLHKVIRNNDLNLGFIENEILSDFKKIDDNYLNACRIISEKYKLSSEFINKYYCHHSQLVGCILYDKHEVDVNFWDLNFSLIQRYHYHAIIGRQNLTYNFIIKYMDKLKSSYKDFFKDLKQHQYKNFNQEQIEHIESIELMDTLSL